MEAVAVSSLFFVLVSPAFAFDLHRDLSNRIVPVTFDPVEEGILLSDRIRAVVRRMAEGPDLFIDRGDAEEILGDLDAGALAIRTSRSPIVSLRTGASDGQNLLWLPRTFRSQWTCGKQETAVAHQVKHVAQALDPNPRELPPVDEMPWKPKFEQPALTTEFGYFLVKCPTETGTEELKDLADLALNGEVRRIERLQAARILDAQLAAQAASLRFDNGQVFEREFRQLIELARRAIRAAEQARTYPDLERSYRAIRTMTRIMNDRVEIVPQLRRDVQGLERDGAIPKGAAGRIRNNLLPEFNKLAVDLPMVESTLWKRLLPASGSG
jgi:hypothetical protein